MEKRPIIGVTPGFMREANRLFAVRGYVEGVNEAGGLAFILPLILDDDMACRIIESVDGILFAGGPDIDARYFGEENLKYGGEISPERDRAELLLAGKAIAAEVPILGICRGVQLINTALGGTLYQDIDADRGSGKPLKHRQEAPGWFPVHDVRIEEGSRLFDIYHTNLLGVNSFHHQAVKDVGRGLAVAAASSDGITEAVERSGNQFILGVQWHPELMWRETPVHLKLFEAFVNAAGEYGFKRKDAEA